MYSLQEIFYAPKFKERSSFAGYFFTNFKS